MPIDPQIAAELIGVVDRRFDQLSKMQPRSAYGTVFSVDSANFKASVYVSGDATPSPGFTFAPWMIPAVGDRVRVVIDPRGDRYVAEVLSELSVRDAPVGYIPHSPRWFNTQTYPSTTTLAANGGSAIIPIEVSARMRLRGYRFWSKDTASARSATGRLYLEGADQILRAVPGSDGTWNTFTPSAASSRGAALDSGTNLELRPGWYMFLIRNTHATNTLGVGHIGASSADFIGLLGAYTEVLGSMPATIDLSAGSWSGTGAFMGVALVADSGNRPWA